MYNLKSLSKIWLKSTFNQKPKRQGFLWKFQKLKKFRHAFLSVGGDIKGDSVETFANKISSCIPGTSYKPPVTNNRLPLTSYKLTATGTKLLASSYRLPGSSYWLPATSYQILATIFGEYAQQGTRTPISVYVCKAHTLIGPVVLLYIC